MRIFPAVPLTSGEWADAGQQSAGRGFSGIPDAAGAVCGIAPERSGEEREPLPNGGRSGAAALEPAGNAEKSENAVKPHLEQTISKGNNCFHVGKRAAGNRIEQRKRCLTKIAV
mgnify:CR=1 FL=1